MGSVIQLHEHQARCVTIGMGKVWRCDSCKKWARTKPRLTEVPCDDSTFVAQVQDHVDDLNMAVLQHERVKATDG